MSANAVLQLGQPDVLSCMYASHWLSFKLSCSGRLYAIIPCKFLLRSGSIIVYVAYPYVIRNRFLYQDLRMVNKCLSTTVMLMQQGCNGPLLVAKMSFTGCNTA